MNAGQGRFQDGGNSYSYNAAGPNGNRGNSFEGQVHMNNGPMGAARGGGNNDYYAQNRGGGQKGGRYFSPARDVFYLGVVPTFTCASGWSWHFAFGPASESSERRMHKPTLHQGPRAGHCAQSAEE